MADLLDLVELDKRRGSVRPLLDLQSGPDALYTLRGTLSLGGVAPTVQIAAGQRPREAGRVAGRTDQPRAVTGMWMVKGASTEEAVARIEELLARVGSGQAGRFMRWQPDGHPEPVLMRLIGPGSWESTYQWVQWAAQPMMQFQLSWPVEPDGYGLPWDVYDDWADPALPEWTRVVDGLGLTVLGPQDMRATVAGTSSMLVHQGRGAGPRVNDEVTLTYTHAAGYEVWAILSYVDQNNYVWARYTTAGVSIGYTTGGVATANWALQNIEDPSPGTTYTLRLARAGPRGFEAQLWGGPAALLMASAGSAAGRVVSPPLKAGVAPEPTFIAGGHAGLRVERTTGVVPSDLRVKTFRRRPFTWANRGEVAPRHVRVPRLPGTVDGPAVDCDVHVQPAARANTGPVSWATVGWTAWRRENLLPNPGGVGHLRDGTDAPTQGWANSGADLAAGSAPSASGNFPGALNVQTFAAGQGVAAGGAVAGVLYGEFAAGRPYTLSAEIRAADQAGGPVTLDVGVGDIALPVGAAWSDPIVANKRTVQQFVAPIDQWVRVAVTVYPTYDEQAIQARFLVPAAAASFAVRDCKLYEGLPADHAQVPAAGSPVPFGRLYPAMATDREGTAGTYVAADGRNEYTHPTTAFAKRWGWRLDASRLAPPDYARPILLEVYAELMLPPAAVGSAIRVGVQSGEGQPGVPTSYGVPHGPDGMTLTPPATVSRWRVVRLGTVTLDPADQGRHLLLVEHGGAAGASGTVTLSSVVLVPVYQRCLLPTGRQPDSAYPHFIPATAMSPREELGRIIHTDLASSLLGEVTGTRFRASSMGGEPIRIPAGEDLVLLPWMVQGVPNDPTAGDHNHTPVAGWMVHLAVTPRYSLAALAP